MGVFSAVVVPVVAGRIVQGFLDGFFGGGDPDGPAPAAYQARGEVRSEVATKRWVVGRTRIAGVLSRHVEVVNEDLARAFFDDPGDEYDGRPNDRQRSATERMELYDYLGYVLSEGEIEGISYAWVDGVRMNLAENRSSVDSILADGEFGPAADGEKLEPFFFRYFVLVRERTEGSPVRRTIRQDPTIALWVGKGEADSYPARKLRQVYAAGNASDDEKADAQGIQGLGLSHVLVRLRQANVDGQPGPWNRIPQIDFLVRGKGPPAPTGVPGTLLDGNPAKAAYWFLTQRMGVAPALIDDVWRQSVAICDEPFTVGAIKNPPVATLQEILGLIRRPGLIAQLRAIAQELGLDPDSASSIQPAYDEYHRRRLVRVVERFTGRDFVSVGATTVAAVVAKWNERFTGSPDQADGTRPRYRANGVIPSTADPTTVLAGLARAMAGSIEEHGGVWHIRAGSLSVRPGNVIQDEDIVDGVVTQLLEPSLADQPDEIHARLIQNERLEYERFVMDPVDRIEANIGEIDATNRPAIVRAQEQETAGVQPSRVHDVGDMDFVTDPLQADELMRIALYQTRWNTRTINLTIRPGADFEFYKLSRGEPVLLNVRDENIMGERVGERTDSMRCIVADAPRYLENGNIELTLREQEEETFGEKFGLVFDYNDAGDVRLVPPPPPPVEPPTCDPTSRTVTPGTLVAPRTWQVVARGGTGRLTYGLQWQGADPGMRIDAATGVISGRVPTSTVDSTYTGTASVTDVKGRKGSCAVTLNVNVAPPPTPTGDNPWIEVTGLQGAQPGETTSWRARVRFPELLSRAFDGARDATWVFRLRAISDDVAVPSGASVSTGGVGGWIPPPGASPESTDVYLRATATGLPSLTARITFTVDPATTTCSVVLRNVQVKRNERLDATSIFSARNNVTGSLTVGVVLPGVGQPSPLPSGLSLSASGMLSGLTNIRQGTYTVPVSVRDQHATPANRVCVQTGTFRVEVSGATRSQSCTIALRDDPTSGPNVTVARTGAVWMDVVFAGFSGAVPRPTFRGPSWMSLRPVANQPSRYALLLASGRPAGQAGYSIRAGSAACGGTITVREDPPPRLRMDDVPIQLKEGDTFSSGLNAVGGPPGVPVTYEWVGAVPAEQIGLVLDTRSGNFGGTATTGSSGASPYTYTARARKGTLTTTCTVTVTIATDDTPPPPTISCVGAEVSGRPGAAVSATITCESDLQITAGATSVAASPGDGSWLGTFTFSGVIGDPGQPGSSGRVASFSTTIPSGTTPGRYTFTTSMTGGRTVERVSVVVTVSDVPLSVVGSMAIRTWTTASFIRRYSARGGPVAGNVSFSRAGGPSFIRVASNGVVRLSRGLGAGSGTWRLRVQKGAESATFDGTWEVERAGGGTPGDERA